MRIALMATCLADAIAPSVARATVTVLERLGHEVVFPAGQTCCGQMHVNTGYRREALALVEHHVEVFDAALDSCEAVVAPSGSCVGSVRHQHEGLAERAGRPPNCADSMASPPKGKSTACQPPLSFTIWMRPVMRSS